MEMLLYTMDHDISNMILWTVYGIGNHTIVYIYEDYGSGREKRKHGQIKYYISLIGIHWFIGRSNKKSVKICQVLLQTIC